MDGIRRDFDAVSEAEPLAALVDALAVDVELPAVVGAAKTAFLVTAEEQRGSRVRAGLLDQPDVTVGVPEGDEVLTQQPDPGRRPIGLSHLGTQARRDPVPAEQTAHERAGTDPGQDLVVFLR
jgi:hypothetical protein